MKTQLLRLMAWAYLAASIAGAVYIQNEFGKRPAYPNDPRLSILTEPNPTGSAIAIAVGIQGCLAVLFSLTFADAVDDVSAIRSRIESA